MTELGSAAAANPATIDAVATVLRGVRGAKSQAKVSMRARLSVVTVTGPQELLDRVALAGDDLIAVGKIDELVLTASEGTELEIDATLAPVAD